MLLICEFWQLSLVWRANESKKPDESYKYLLLYIEDKIEGDIWDTYTDTSSIRISDRWWIVWQVSDIWHVCDTVTDRLSRWACRNSHISMTWADVWPNHYQDNSL